MRVQKRTHDTPSQATRHQRKPNEQEQTGSPNDRRFSSIGSLTQQTFLVDDIDDEKAESRTYPGDPVDKRYMDRDGVVW